MEVNYIDALIEINPMPKELVGEGRQFLSRGLNDILNEIFIGNLYSIFLRILYEHGEPTRLKKSNRLLYLFYQRYLIFNSIKEFLEFKDAELILDSHNIFDTILQENYYSKIPFQSMEESTNFYSTPIDGNEKQCICDMSFYCNPRTYLN